jgi:N-methylhydantoinase B/oxoprolinase/acetone carboxylase alpha subunit
MRGDAARAAAGTYRARDVLDDDGSATSARRSRRRSRSRAARARVDFAGTSPQTHGRVNANFAVTRSAVLYVFTALAARTIPRTTASRAARASSRRRAAS